MSGLAADGLNCPKVLSNCLLKYICFKSLKYFNPVESVLINLGQETPHKLPKSLLIGALNGR